MKISKKYKPLFDLLFDKHPEVDTVILTGGRLSAKSHSVGVFSAESFIQYDWKVLYTRFTNVSIEDSIVAEFKDKLEINNYKDYCNIVKARVKSTCGDGEVVFKGIKTGSKAQTASLKSLSGFNCFIVDEAEEIPDYETFKKVYYSIRSKDKRNISILILNPTIKEHWIYQKYYLDKVEDGFNGVRDNVMYIHTSYLDVAKEHIPNNILNDYIRLKTESPEDYASIIMGGWVDNVEGQLFTNLKSYKKGDLRIEDVEFKATCADIADKGTDYLCILVGFIVGNKVYIDDVIMDNSESSITQPRAVSFYEKHKAEFNWIESNNSGNTYANYVKRDCKNVAFKTFNAVGNKETRIISNEAIITDHFVFRSDYELNSDYHIFMKQLKKFNKNEKLNGHDDAPDATASLARILNRSFPHLFSRS